MLSGVLRKFIQFEASASLILILATLLALLTANSRFYDLYDVILHTPFSLSLSTLSFSKPLLFWINDCLMVVFFFLIGLEIKREYIQGHLSIPTQRILPATATLGGIVVPALIFTVFNYNNSINMQGWAIPTTTDIAFALGALMLIKGIPKSLRLFLLTVAVLDDLAAVLIIAIFYAKNLSLVSLLGAALILTAMVILNRLKIKRISIYIILSLVLWVFVLQSGIHATIAGVLAAFTIPLEKNKTEKKNPLVIIEETLHPWVAFGILPIFAFANSGIPFGKVTFTHLIEPLPLGIITGLFIGKQLGVLIGTWVPITLKWGKLPKNVSWKQLYGVSILCGIGYTMSLFIGMLAFENGGSEYDYRIKCAILVASLCSFIYGFLILKCSMPIKK